MKNLIQKYLKTFTIIGACSFIIACGGGGGSSDAPTSRSDNKEINAPGESQVELSWYIPDARENGEDLEVYEIDGYRIYYSTADTSVQEGEIVTINDPQTTEYTFESLPSGDYRLAIATVDTQGLQSALSEEILVAIPWLK